MCLSAAAIVALFMASLGTRLAPSGWATEAGRPPCPQFAQRRKRECNSGSPNARKREWDYGSPNAAGSGNAIHHILHVTTVFSNAV